MGFRAKLITSYLAVILVTLVLALAFFAFVVRQDQEQNTRQAKDRLRTVTTQVSQNIANLRPSRFLEDYQNSLQTLAPLFNVRLLLIDSDGQIRADSDTNAASTMLNQTIAGYKLVPRDLQSHSNNIQLRNVQYFYYARPGPALNINTTQTQTNRVDWQPTPLQVKGTVETDLWLAVPEATLNAAWDDLLKGMLTAAALALILAIGLALVIARSIARPLMRMTRASVAIAQGNYTEQLPVKGRDEMGRLATSFNQMAREVSRSQQTMRDFVANVSHELKTPLTSIQGFSQAIVEGVADDPAAVQHSATVIYDEAARMRRLVDGLLDLSRIESGQVALNRRELDLTTLLGRVIIRLGPLADSKKLTISHRLGQERGLCVLADPDRLEQVFTNILDNAIKYSPEGGLIWLEVQTGPASTLAQTDEAGRGKHTRLPYACVNIGNHGPLIPADELPRIFERFYKLDRSRKRRGESTGLGLAITKELVEAHGGTIWVKSEPTPARPDESYTLFTVCLPLITPVSPSQNNLPHLLKR